MEKAGRAFVIAALCLGLVFAGLSARAQFAGGGGVQSPPDLSGYVTTSAMNAAIASMESSMQAWTSGQLPQPANSAPISDSTTAAIGSQTTRYMLADSVRPARYRSGSCTLAGGVGTCSLTWSTPFATTPNPIGDPAVINAGAATAMIQCNWTAISTTGATIKCVQPAISLTISLGALTLLPNATNGLVVSGTAVQPL